MPIAITFTRFFYVWIAVQQRGRAALYVLVCLCSFLCTASLPCYFFFFYARPNSVKIKSRYFAGFCGLKHVPCMSNLLGIFVLGHYRALYTQNDEKDVIFKKIHNLITECTPAAPWWCRNAGMVRVRLFSLGGVSGTRAEPLG